MYTDVGLLAQMARGPLYVAAFPRRGDEAGKMVKGMDTHRHLGEGCGGG